MDVNRLVLPIVSTLALVIIILSVVFVSNNNSFNTEITTSKVLLVEGFHLWQHTWIDIRPEDHLQINCLKWNEKYPPVGMGIKPVNSPSSFVLSDVSIGALVGRIGNSKFLIGQGTTHIADKQEQGELRICPNYAFKSSFEIESNFRTAKSTYEVEIIMTRKTALGNFFQAVRNFL